MVGESKKLSTPAVTISPFQWSTSTRHGVDVTRQAAAGFGCMAAMDVEKWLEEVKSEAPKVQAPNQ